VCPTFLAVHWVCAREVAIKVPSSFPVKYPYTKHLQETARTQFLKLALMGQCPRGSRQRFVERLPSSRAGDWRLRAKAGCSRCYVGPNITPIMLSPDLCDVQYVMVDQQRSRLRRTSHKLVRVEPGTSADQDCPASVFAVAAVCLHTCPRPSPSSPDRFPHRCSWYRWRRGPAMRGSC
jgi:hypothetical protein